jgi:Cd2+/Zn2+-exporting ATPase
MTDEPSKVAEGVQIAKYTKRIVWQNIIFALITKAVFLILGAFGIATMWEAVFADVGVTLLAVLNSVRVLKSPIFLLTPKYKNVIFDNCCAKRG